MIPWSYQVMLLILVAIAAGFDIRYRRIPNWLVATALVWGIVTNTFLYGWPGLKASLIGIAIPFLIYFPMFLLRGMGAGDVKLMMAIGGLVGAGNWFQIFIITCITGAAAGLLMVICRKCLRRTLFNVAFIAGELLRFRPPYIKDEKLDVNAPQAITMPHGAAIAAGSFLFVFGQSLLNGR